MKLTTIATAVVLTASIALAASVKGVQGEGSTPKDTQPNVVYLTSDHAW